MAMELSGPRAGSRGADLRHRALPWLAAVVNLAYAAALAVRRRFLPAALAATTWWTDLLARALTAGLRHGTAGTSQLVAVTATGVAAGTRTATALTGTLVQHVGVGVTVGGRLMLRTVDAVERRAVPHLITIGVLSGRRGRLLWTSLRPRLPTLALRSATLSGAVLATVSVALVLSGPVLKLSARALNPQAPYADTGGLPPLEERSVVYAGDGSTLAILHREVDRRVVPLDRVPAHVQQAVIAAEDRRFRSHEGYDLEALGRALLANVRARGVSQGGSTITQQLAKQNFVGADRTLTRKGSELLHAVALEEHFTKDDLLERYLNQVYFGSGAYGIAAAAEEFFGGHPEDLTVDQAALLAGLIRSPGALDPRAEPERAAQRRNGVLAAMAQEGYLDEADARALASEPVELSERRGGEQSEPAIVEAVKREFLADPAFGEGREERAELLFTGGLRIHTAVDPQLQEQAAEAVAAYVRDDGPTAALAAVEPGTGRIRALHSGLAFADEQYDLAVQGRRQPGSAFKPFVAVAALEAGMSPWQPLHGDGPVTFAVPGSADRWRVDNHQGRGHGEVRLSEAMTSSVNTAFAQLALGVGLDDIVDVGRRVGIDPEQALGPPETRGPAIALGGLTRGVSPLEMAGAYAMFAAGGEFAVPHLIVRVTDARGEVVHERTHDPEQVLDPSIAAAVTDMLTDAVAGGTGAAARIPGWEVAGKTGTTQDSADAWFVGAAPVLSTAVWVGHHDGQRPVPGLTGGSTPARIWQAFTSAALADREPVGFPTAAPLPRGQWLALPTAEPD